MLLTKELKFLIVGLYYLNKHAKRQMNGRKKYLQIRTFKELDRILTCKNCLPTVFIFTAAWLGNGIFVDRWAEVKAEKLTGKIDFFRVDIDKVPEVQENLAIERLPSGYFVKDGEICDHFSGMISRAVFDKKVNGLLDN